jgi:NADH-ubiquinone/plastoquinone oxidoreductase, chain 3
LIDSDARRSRCPPYSSTGGFCCYAGATADLTFLFYEMVIFFLILLVGYAYAWGKGVFRYD